MAGALVRFFLAFMPQTILGIRAELQANLSENTGSGPGNPKNRKSWRITFRVSVFFFFFISRKSDVAKNKKKKTTTTTTKKTETDVAIIALKKVISDVVNQLKKNKSID